MPERQHSRLFSPKISGTEDRIGMPLEKGLQKSRVLTWVVLQVGILNEAEVARRALDSRPHGCAFSPVDRMLEQSDARVGRRKPFQNGRCAIRRAVVDDDEFSIHFL